MAGLRYNKGKNRLDLLPFDTIWHIGEVLTAGAKKYEDRNWEKGMNFSIVVGCLMRHLIKFMTGNNIDKETGIPHIDLVMFNAIMLSRYYRKHKEFDDRPVESSELIEDDVIPNQNKLENDPIERFIRVTDDLDTSGGS
jgi:hypothetical protein